jgi:hypothetical protein
MIRISRLYCITQAAAELERVWMLRIDTGQEEYIGALLFDCS